MTSDATSPIEVGQVLAGKYKIDRVLGAGGMGVVVAATHLHLDQRVAIKFLLPAALSNQDVVSRFQREARAAAKIQSEHVARVIDVGALDSGAPYMVMEYLEGRDLAERIAAEERLPVVDVVRFVLEACEALAEAHMAGIVHRDLKPANLFLAKRADKTSMVKVLDFGISKSSFGGGSQTSTQTVMGSPYYMSPEQLMSAKHVDQRSDIWSLGIVLYESLTGSPPYMGETLPEIVAKILQASTPSVRAERPDISPELDAVIGRCLAKDANARFRDVAELAKCLAPFSPDGQRSLDRISRVIGGAPSGVRNAPQVIESQPRGLTVAMPGSNPAIATQQSAAQMTSSGAWAGTQAAFPEKKSRMWIGFIAAAFVLIGGVSLAIVATRKHEPIPTVASTVVATTATTAAVTTTTAVTATVTPPALLMPIAAPTADAIDNTKPKIKVAGPSPKPVASVSTKTPSSAPVTVVSPPIVTAQVPTPPPPPPNPTNQGLRMDMK